MGSSRGREGGWAACTLVPSRSLPCGGVWEGAIPYLSGFLCFLGMRVPVGPSSQGTGETQGGPGRWRVGHALETAGECPRSALVPAVSPLLPPVLSASAGFLLSLTVTRGLALYTQAWLTREYPPAQTLWVVSPGKALILHPRHWWEPDRQHSPRDPGVFWLSLCCFYARCSISLMTDTLPVRPVNFKGVSSMLLLKKLRSPLLSDGKKGPL